MVLITAKDEQSLDRANGYLLVDGVRRGGPSISPFGRGTGLAGMEPAVAAQSFAFTTATASDPFGARTRMVRFYSSVDCFVAFGEDPEATAESTPVTAKVGEFFGVAPGHKVSVYNGVS